MKCGWQHIFSLGLVIICPNIAFAGAWLPNKGTTEFIFSANSVGSDPSHKITMEYYLARGLNDNTALIFSQNFKAYNDFPAISKTDLKLQFKLLQKRGLVISSQFGISTIDNARFSIRENNNMSALLLGYDFANNWINFEYGVEKCYGDYQATSEITLGRHIYKKDLLILKKFNAGCDYYNENDNFQLSYVRQFNQNLGVEFGLRQSNSRARFDQSQSRNSGFVLSLWKRY
jgi:hypothetical protein